MGLLLCSFVFVFRLCFKLLIYLCFNNYDNLEVEFFKKINIYNKDSLLKLKNYKKIHKILFNFYLNLYSNNYISNDKDKYLFYRKFIKYNSLSPNKLIYNKLNENIFFHYDSNLRDRYFNIIEYITDLKIEYMNYNNPIKKINNRYYKDNEKNENINIKMGIIDILKTERLNYLPCYNSLKYKFKDYIKNVYKKKNDIKNYKKEIDYLKNNKNKRKGKNKYENLIERENKIIELTNSLNMIIDYEEIEIPEKMEIEEIKIIYENDFT